ncbi:MAG TPA: hypothetical protein VIN67_01415 [Desulfobaccales bacterium]
MIDQNFTGRRRPFRSSFVLVLLCVMVLGGCQTGEPPLTPAAASFKKEVQDCLNRLSQGLAESIVKKDVPALNETLKQIEPDALKLCRMCPFRIGILDKTGNALTVYPYKPEAVGNFSNYDVVVRTMKNQKINQQRFYLQDGSQMYIICVPLFQGDDLVGIMALSLSAADAKSRWGLSEKEFLAIDFNRKS